MNPLAASGGEWTRENYSRKDSWVPAIFPDHRVTP